MPLTILSTDLEIQTALKNVLKSGRRFPVDIFLALTKEDIPNTWRKFGAGNNLSIVEGVLEANGSMSRLAETFARAIDGEYSDYVRCKILFTYASTVWFSSSPCSGEGDSD